MSENYRNESRKEWRSSAPLPTSEEIQVGCLQRIADATEQMAKNYVELQREKEYYKRNCEQERDYRRMLERKIISLRGVITRQKNRLDDKSTS